MMSLHENRYVVFGAVNTSEALETFDREDGRLRWSFPMGVLPNKDGLELVGQLLSHKRELQVLLSSGYMDQKWQWLLIRERGF